MGLTRKNDIVCKTLDYQLNQELKKLPGRKITITIKFVAKIGNPMYMEVSDGENTISLESISIEEAEKAPMPLERIKEQLEKLGETPFISRNTIIDSDPNVFISIKELNELRRNVINLLQEKRMESTRQLTPQNINFVDIGTTSEKGFTVEVETREQLEKVNKLNALRIYTTNEELYNSYKMDDRVYYKLPRCRLEIERNLKRKNLVNEYFDFNIKEGSEVGDAGLNVTNIYTAYYLYKLGLPSITLSQELSKEEIINFINNYAKTFNKYPRIEVFSYGRIENMLIKGNILNIQKNDKTYELVDVKEKKFPVFYDGYHTHVMNYELTNKEDLKELKDYITYRFKFDKENEEEIEKIIKSYINN